MADERHFIIRDGHFSQRRKANARVKHKNYQSLSKVFEMDDQLVQTRVFWQLQQGRCPQIAEPCAIRLQRRQTIHLNVKQKKVAKQRTIHYVT